MARRAIFIAVRTVVPWGFVHRETQALTTVQAPQMDDSSKRRR
jgi:hypothetical protein